MDHHLSANVQMQFMRPGQLEAALRRFPVVYVPFGLIEWHGRHLPLGNDALKAHAILVKCAEVYGGVVYPPVYFPSAAYARGEFQQADLDVEGPPADRALPVPEGDRRPGDHRRIRAQHRGADRDDRHRP